MHLKHCAVFTHRNKCREQSPGRPTTFQFGSYQVQIFFLHQLQGLMKSSFFFFYVLAQQQETKSLIVSAGLVSLVPVDWERECEGLCAGDWLKSIQWTVGCELGPQQAFSFSLLLSSLCCEPGFISCIICSLNKQAHSWPAFKPTHLASAHRGTRGRRFKFFFKSDFHSEGCIEKLIPKLHMAEDFC